MSEKRIPDYVFIRRLPKKQGKKTVKIELFQCGQFRDAWTIEARDAFSPKLPYKYDDRVIYWEQELFRVRKDGRWFGDDFRYVFLSWVEVVELLRAAKEK